MSPLSGSVLTGATIVASPALWQSLVDGTMPLDVALTRFLIAIAGCWLAFTIVAELAFPSPGSVKPLPPADQKKQDPAASDHGD